MVISRDEKQNHISNTSGLGHGGGCDDNNGGCSFLPPPSPIPSPSQVEIGNMQNYIITNTKV